MTTSNRGAVRDLISFCARAMRDADLFVRMRRCVFRLVASMVISPWGAMLALTTLSNDLAYAQPVQIKPGAPEKVIRPEDSARLILEIYTGGDDLRGGNDNVDAFILLRDGRLLRRENINKSQRWPNNSRHEVVLPLTPTLTAADVLALRLEVSFTGGVAGDNWNVDRLVVRYQGPKDASPRVLTDVSGRPYVRFTGDRRALQIRLSAKESEELRARPVQTGFQPARHGFRFINQFKFPIGVFDVTVAGLCGGMAYTVLDYRLANQPIPTQPYMPPPGSSLFSYLFNRQVASLKNNLDKWGELAVNPGGARNREFFIWGLQVGSGRLGELRSNIDQGRPVVLGLWECGGDCGCPPEECPKSHQVVAIGYDLGRYYGDPERFAEDVKIFVYDPNFPGRTMTLRPNLRGAYYYYEEEAKEKRWRAYFVDMKYRPARPPASAMPGPRNEVWATFVTGGDDLRGGNDNVHMILLHRDGRTIRFDNVNDRKRWINNSVNHVARPLPDDLRPGDIVGVRLETTFGGGIGGDNWNLDQFYLNLRYGAGTDWQEVLKREASKDQYLFRFTGEQKVWEVRW